MELYWEIIADRVSKEGWSWGYFVADHFKRANHLHRGWRIAMESGSSFTLMKS
jgi:hypothetical protein